MKVVHLCVSHISNLPWFWHRALNEHTEIESVHIYGNEATWFGWDIQYWIRSKSSDQEREEIVQQIKSADLVIFHGHANELSLFGGIRLAELLRGKPILHYLCAPPHYMLAHANTPLFTWRKAVMRTPHLVVEAGMLGEFPGCEVIPIFLPAFDDRYLPSPIREDPNRPLRVVISSTAPTAKGVPIMLEGLGLLKQRSRREIIVENISGLHHDQLMQVKREADFVMESLWSEGGWGLNGCEAASLGKLAVCRFSPHAKKVYDRILGCGVPQCISPEPDPESIASAMLPFVEDDSMRIEMGKSARKWVEKFWSLPARAPLLQRVIQDFMEHRSNVRHAV